MLRTLSWYNDVPNTGKWKDRHISAVCSPRPGAEKSIGQAVDAWIQYALAHRAGFDDGIGNDGVLGVYWCQWGKALLGLLDGDTGRLDCGTLWSIIDHNLTEEGFPEKDR